jgi:hypothetical protein
MFISAALLLITTLTCFLQSQTWNPTEYFYHFFSIMALNKTRVANSLKGMLVGDALAVRIRISSTQFLKCVRHTVLPTLKCSWFLRLSRITILICANTFVFSISF